LTSDAARVAHGKNPDGMTFAARALRAAWAMADGAVEERAPQNGGKIQGAGKDAVPFGEDALVIPPI